MPSSKTNILFILTDQQRADTLSCYDQNTQCQTPHLDAIAGQSTVFQNAYTVCAVCSPARASLQTGYYPHAHGVETNIYERGCLIHELPDREYLLSRRLQEAGYATGYTGKWHLGLGGPSSGFYFNELRSAMVPAYSGLPSDVGYEGDDFPGHGGGGYQYELYKDYLEKNGLSFDIADLNKEDTWHTITGEVTSPIESTNEYFLVEQAIHYIEQFRLRDQPFCFQLHFWGPHSPFYAPAQYLDIYRDMEMSPWPNFDEDRQLKPTYQDAFRRPDQPWSFWENSLRYYYGFMSSIDAQIGRLMAYLNDTGLYDDTAIIFSADHGDSQGCHGGIENKSYHMYQEAVRIPLFVKPGRPDSTQHNTDAFAITCDIYSTILDLAGVSLELAEAGHGRSLQPFLQREEPDDWRDVVVSEGASATPVICTHRMIRRGDWKYVFYASGVDELYNLRDDPWEITNLILEPAHQPERKALQQALYRWMGEYGDELRDDYGRLRPDARV